MGSPRVCSGRFVGFSLHFPASSSILWQLSRGISHRSCTFRVWARRFAEYDEDELAHLAARSRLPQKVVLDTARLTAEAFLDLWRAEKAHLPLSAAAVRAIDAQLRLVPLSRGRAPALDGPRRGGTMARFAATGANP